MKKLLSLFMTAICFLTLWGCTEADLPRQTSSISISETIPDTTTIETTAVSTTPAVLTAEQAVKVYEKFFSEKQSVKLRNDSGDLYDADPDFPNRKWIDYAYYDMNGDGISELHVRGQGTYTILTYWENELVVWTAPGIYAKPLNNGATLGAYNSIFAMQYYYQEYDFFGVEQLRIDFEKSNPHLVNGEYIFDETSNYYFEGEKVSKAEWDALTEPYFLIGSDKIEWIEYVPQ